MPMADKRKKFSPEEKVRLLRLHLIEKEPLRGGELSSGWQVYNCHPILRAAKTIQGFVMPEKPPCRPAASSAQHDERQGKSLNPEADLSNSR